MLAQKNIKLMEAFQANERVKDLDLKQDELPLQCTLGVLWNVEIDRFMFQMSTEKRPYTRKGVCQQFAQSLRVCCPENNAGEKILLRELSTEHSDWDNQLPAKREEEWNRRDSMTDLEDQQRPWCYLSVTAFCTEPRTVFLDASTLAIEAVAYLKAVTSEGQCHTRFHTTLSATYITLTKIMFLKLKH